MTENKRFKLHIEWYNQEKTEGEFVLKDGGQPLGVINSIEDARLIRDTLNELNDENEQLKSVNMEYEDALGRLEEENEELKQFKENVIKWVDSQMKFNAKKYIETEDYHFKSENVDLHNFKVFIGIDSND